MKKFFGYGCYCVFHIPLHNKDYNRLRDGFPKGCTMSPHDAIEVMVNLELFSFFVENKENLLLPMQKNRRDCEKGDDIP